VPAETAATMSGLELLQGMIAGRFPGPPIMQLIAPPRRGGERTRRVREHAGFQALQSARDVHGGYAATLLDSCMGCSVHTTLPKGHRIYDARIKVSLVRAITGGYRPGARRRQGLNSGRRVATAEGRLTDARGRLLAHATTTCLVFELPAKA